MNKYLLSLGKLFVIGLAAFLGAVFGRMRAPEATVHAQESFTGVVSCVTAVPKSWGDFMGGSPYGLAFQDKEGNIRLVSHPSCGSLNSPMEPVAAPIDLEIERR